MLMLMPMPEAHANAPPIQARMPKMPSCAYPSPVPASQRHHVYVYKPPSRFPHASTQPIYCPATPILHRSIALR